MNDKGPWSSGTPTWLSQWRRQPSRGSGGRTFSLIAEDKWGALVLSDLAIVGLIMFVVLGTVVNMLRGMIFSMELRRELREDDEERRREEEERRRELREGDEEQRRELREEEERRREASDGWIFRLMIVIAAFTALGLVFTMLTS